MHELLELETRGWLALCTSGDAGRRFYAPLLHEDAIMLFPGDLVIAGREAILASISDAPWEAFDVRDQVLVEFSDQVAAVVYRVVAHHGGAEPYRALVSSTYVRADGAWRLVLHQQTPA